MKAELSHTWAQIEQIMGMIQQLLQTKSADGGQQEGKSGNSANDESGAPEGHRPKKGSLPQELVPQQKLLQGENCPATAAERQMDQDLPTTRTGDQRFQLAWVR